MNIASIIQPNRFWALLKRDALQQWRGLLIGTGAVAGVLFVYAILSSLGSDSDLSDMHENAFPFFLFLGGFLFTASIFNEMDGITGRQFYLQLPASQAEKFFSKLLLSSIGFLAFAVVVYTLFAALNNFVVKWVNHYDINAFLPISKTNLNYYSSYLVTQAVFLLGAVWFRKYVFGKTLLSLFAVSILFSIVFTLVVRFMFGGEFNKWEGDFSLAVSMENFLNGFYIDLLKYLYWLVLAPVLWIVAYFKLKETEV